MSKLLNHIFKLYKQANVSKKAETIEQQINDSKYSIDTENADNNKLLGTANDLVFAYDVISKAMDMAENQKEDEFAVYTLSSNKDKIVNMKYIKKDDVYNYKPNQNEYGLVRVRDTGFIDTDYQLQPMIMIVRSWNEDRKFYARKTNNMPKKAENEDLIEVGWSLYSSDEDMIQDLAEDMGRRITKNFWDKINKDISKVERWFLREGYRQFFTNVRDEGHGSNGDLGGTAWMTKQQLQDFISQAEKYDENSYAVFESDGTLGIDVSHDDAVVFHSFIYIDDKDLDKLGIEAKKVNRNKKQSSKRTKLTKKAWTDAEKKQVGALEDKETGKYNIYQTNGGEIVLTNHQLDSKKYALMDTANTFEELMEKYEKDWEEHDNFQIIDKQLLSEYEKYKGIDINDWLEDDSEEEYENYHFFDLTKDYVEETKEATTNKKAGNEDLIAIGWGLYTYENNIKANAEDDGRTIDREFWNKINNDIDKVESWFLKEGYKKFFTKVRDEGHGKDSELGGTAFVTEEQLKNFIDRAEGMNGSFVLTETSGTLEFPIYYDETIFFELVIFVDEEILDDLNIESKKNIKNKKQSSKTKAMRKRADLKSYIEEMDKAWEKHEENFFKEYEQTLLTEYKGNLAKATQDLINSFERKLPKETLYKLLKEYIDRPSFEKIEEKDLQEAQQLVENFNKTNNEYEKNKKTIEQKIEQRLRTIYEMGYRDYKYDKDPIQENDSYWGNYTEEEKQAYYDGVEAAKSGTTQHKYNAFYWKTQSSKTNKLIKQAEEDLNKEYKLLENGLPVFQFNKKIIDFLDGINGNFDKFCINLYGKKVCFVGLKNKMLITDKGEEYDYRDFSAGALIKIYNKINNNKQATKKKADFLGDFKANVLVINSKQLEQIRDTAKDMGDEIWAKINGKIEKIIAYGYDNGKLKIVYREPYYGEEEIQEMYDNADEVEYIDFETLELQKQSSKNSATKKQASLKYYAVSESGSNFGSNDNKDDLKEEIREYVVAHKDNFEKKEKIYLKESDTDKTIEEIIVRDILTPYGSKKWVIVATKKQAGIDPIPTERVKLNFDMPIELADKVKKELEEKNIKYESRKGKYTVEFSVDIETDKMGIVQEIVRNIKKMSSTKKTATIKHENGVYNVYSESGKCLGKGYKTKEEAEKRLKQVEYFKHKKASKEDTYEEWGVLCNDLDEEWFESEEDAKEFFYEVKNKVDQVVHKVYDVSNEEPEEIQVDVLYDKDRGINKITSNKKSLKSIVISKIAENEDLDLDHVWSIIYKFSNDNIKEYMVTDFDGKYYTLLNLKDVKRQDLSDDSYWKVSERFIRENVKNGKMLLTYDY